MIDSSIFLEEKCAISLCNGNKEICLQSFLYITANRMLKILLIKFYYTLKLNLP